jgi:hypothetical protein
MQVAAVVHPALDDLEAIEVGTMGSRKAMTMNVGAFPSGADFSSPPIGTPFS